MRKLFGRGAPFWCTMEETPRASLWTVCLSPKNLSNRKALVALSCSFTHSQGPHTATGALVQTQSWIFPCTEAVLNPSSGLGSEPRSGSVCEILLPSPCVHKMSLTMGCDPELLVSSRRLLEVAGSVLGQDHVEEGCIISVPGGCSFIKPKYVQL